MNQITSLEKCRKQGFYLIVHHSLFARTYNTLIALHAQNAKKDKRILVVLLVYNKNANKKILVIPSNIN